MDEEARETNEMYDRNTIREVDDYERWEELLEQTKDMMDHQFSILVAFPPSSSSIRC